MRNYVELRYDYICGGFCYGNWFTHKMIRTCVFPLVDLLEKWGRMEEYLHSGVSVSSSRTRQARSRGDTNHLVRYEFLMGFTYEFI